MGILYNNTEKMKKTNLYSKSYFQKRDALPLHLSETLRLTLKGLRVKKVLDVGCGTGNLVLFLKQSGFETIGCDKSRKAVEISGQIMAPATNLPFKDASFDCLTAISLIEHLNLKEAEKFLHEARRILKPKGYLFLVTPNLQSPMRFFKGKNWFAYSDPTHKIFYSPFSLRKLLKQHHFSNFHFRFSVKYETPADWPILLPPLPQPLAFFLNFALISSPLAYFRDSFWLLCQKQS